MKILITRDVFKVSLIVVSFKLKTGVGFSFIIVPKTTQKMLKVDLHTLKVLIVSEKHFSSLRAIH